MGVWPRNEALHQVYVQLREFESTAGERDLREFNEVLGCAAAYLRSDGTVRVARAEARRLADHYLAQAHVAAHGRGRCMLFQALGAVLAHAASGGAGDCDEAAFIASVLAAPADRLAGLH